MMYASKEPIAKIIVFFVLIIVIGIFLKLILPGLTTYKVSPLSVELGFKEIEKIKEETQKDSTKPPPNSIEEYKEEILRLEKIIAFTASIGSSTISPDMEPALHFLFIDLSAEALKYVKEAHPSSEIISVTEKFLPNNQNP